MIQYKRLGQLLIERGVLSANQLDEVIQTRLRTNLRFGEAVIALGYATEDQVTQALADQYGYETVDVSALTPDPEALRLVPQSMALSGLVLPIAVSKDLLTCAIADPLDLPMTDSLGLLARRPVEILLASPSALFEAINRAYGTSPAGRRSLSLAGSLAGSSLRAPSAPTATRPARHRKRPKVRPQEDKFVLLAALCAEALA